MKVIGINSTTNEAGITSATLHVVEEFEPYFRNPEAGRSCVGQKVSTIYVGSYDVSALKIGMEIDVYYEKAVTTARGTFQPVKKIEILAK